MSARSDVPTVHLLSPGDPRQRTGGYLYNARLADALRRRGWVVRVHAVPGRWPVPDDTAHAEVLRHVPPGPVLADGFLWTGANPRHLAARTLVVVHSPLGVEGGEALQAREIAALRGVAGVVSTGGPTQRDLARHGVASELLPPGVQRRARRVPTGGEGPVRVLSLATVTPRKQLERVVDAVAAVPGCEWAVAGSLDRDPACVAALRARIRDRGVEGRVQLLGELDDAGVQAALEACDLLVHAARYEAWGMALTEAMAHGVPVLSTPAGAVEEGGAEVVDVEALPMALASFVADPARRARLAARSWARGRCLPTWDDLAARYAARLEAV